jgi:pectinesterase
MPERSIGNSAVAYGIERMNKEVSQWTRGLSEDDDIHNFPSMPVPRK